jgi:drug/metabolite transporter (DMT)-like permease
MEASMSDDSSQETHQHEERPRRPAWIAGGVLILIGIVFIVRNVTGLELHNWWALFILIPALGSLATAWQMFQKNGRRFTAASRGPLVGGIVLLAVAAVFLFSLDWALAWPFLLILGGGALLLTSLKGRD